MERDTEVTKDTMHPTNNGSTEDVPPPVVPIVIMESQSLNPQMLQLVLQGLTKKHQFHSLQEEMMKDVGPNPPSHDTTSIPIGSEIERSAKSSVMASLEALTGALRVSRLDFMIDNRDNRGGLFVLSVNIGCIVSFVTSWGEVVDFSKGSSRLKGSQQLVEPVIVDYEDYEFGNECAYTKKKDLH
ncbi:hypothetical protein Tco_0628208 [Tanacetum coccineum]|uniref:Uncharacterized protein n=1 Tax=Tanacetum coccineum TaxID=301880 RepID=A0ABQ4WPN0_9ASTR